MNANILQSGISALQSGDLFKAKEYFSQVLKTNPNDPNANQLQGLVYFKLNDVEKAIQFMQRSLSVNANQPHVFNNLAASLKAAGKIEESIDCYQNAIKHKPDYLEAYINLVKVLLGSGDYKTAEDWNSKALSLFPENLALLRLSASLKSKIGDYHSALKIYQTILHSHPSAYDVHHDLGVTLRLLGQSKKALEHYKLASQNGLSNYQLYHNTANAYADIGELALAIENFKNAIQLNPGNVDSHKNLNELLWETNDRENLFGSYLNAFKQDQDNAPLRFAYASALNRLTLFDVAYNFLKELPDQFKQHAEYFDLLGHATNGLGQAQESIEIHRHGIENFTPTHEHLINYAVRLMENDRAEKATEFLEQIIQADPQDQMALGYLGVCWRLLSDDKEQKLNDYDNLVREYILDTPPGYTSIEAFCIDIKKYLDQLHTGTQEPLEQTLKHGTQTRGNLFDDEHPLVQAFVVQVRKCLDDYIRSCPQLFTEEERAQTAQNFIFTGSWSVCLKQQGFHVAHIHPMGRVSSAFYVQLPDDVSDETEHQGWFQLGQPKINLKQSLAPARYVQPRVGKLVFFPSYMWHGTIPFKSDQTRTTIAFDMAPPLI